MTNKVLLKLTLEEYGYDLDDIIYPSDGLIMAITEAMERARLDQIEIIDKAKQDINNKK